MLKYRNQLYCFLKPSYLGSRKLSYQKLPYSIFYAYWNPEHHIYQVWTWAHLDQVWFQDGDDDLVVWSLVELKKENQLVNTRAVALKTDNTKYILKAYLSSLIYCGYVSFCFANFYHHLPS